MVEDGDVDRDMVREVVMAVVREGEAETIALIEGVEAGVAERERLWLWLNVEDVDPDTVAIEDVVMDLLADMETLSDEEVDLEGDTDWDGDGNWELDGVPVTGGDVVGVPEAGIVATSNPIEAGGIHSHNGAVGSLHGSA
jgi:hypothetical protein